MKTRISSCLFGLLLYFLNACQSEEDLFMPPALVVLDSGPTCNVNVDVQLQYPQFTSFDSAYIELKNDSLEIKYNLILDNSTHIATGHIADIPCGAWKISVSYFNTLIPNYKSLESTGTVELVINKTATHLISTANSIFLEDTSCPITPKSFIWEGYFYYQLYLDDTIVGFARLPKDPTNPFFDVSTFQASWLYLVTTRSFYNSSLDGSSNYHQGSCAFELYGKAGDTHDRLEKRITDTTSLKPGILQVKDKTWNFVSGFIIMYDYNGNEVLLYHEWDLRSSAGG